MIKVQSQMAERAVQLLQLEEGKQHYLLDIGTGSGLSGEVLSEKGIQWVGTDISPSMIGVALEREVEGDLCCYDMGQGMMFRAGSFDGCISISALQWLCNADRANHIPQRRLKRFFTSLYRILVQGARAVFQFYPEDAEQLSMINRAAMQAGFSGGLVIDYPNSAKAKKYYLCLFAGEPSSVTRKNVLPRGLGEDYGLENSDAEEQETIAVNKNREYGKKRRVDPKGETRKNWILRKKESQRKAGEDVRPESRYTGRSRKPRF
jgi:18S rRNA (guanine1575-N7)-methyltransferase